MRTANAASRVSASSPPSICQTGISLSCPNTETFADSLRRTTGIPPIGASRCLVYPYIRQRPVSRRLLQGSGSSRGMLCIRQTIRCSPFCFNLSTGSFRSHASHRTKSSSIVLLPLRRLSEIPEEAGSVIGDFQTRTPRSQITVLTPMVQQMVTSFSSQSILHTKARSIASRRGTNEIQQ